MDENEKYDNTLRVLNEFGQAVVDRFKEKFEAAGHVASGQLTDNINYSLDSHGTDIDVNLEIADYFYWAEEYGRQPGSMPPVDRIKEWIETKGIPVEKTLDSFAWAIAKKIARDGNVAYRNGGEHILEQVVAECIAEFEPKLNAALSEDWGEYSIKVLDKINNMIKI